MFLTQHVRAGAQAYGSGESTSGDVSAQFKPPASGPCLASRSISLALYNMVFHFFNQMQTLSNSEISHRNPSFQLLLNISLAAVGGSYIASPSSREHGVLSSSTKGPQPPTVFYLLASLRVLLSVTSISVKNRSFGCLPYSCHNLTFFCLYFTLPSFLNFKLHFFFVFYMYF